MTGNTPTLLKVQQFGLSPTKPLNIKNKLDSMHSLASRETFETMDSFATARENQDGHSVNCDIASGSNTTLKRTENEDEEEEEEEDTSKRMQGLSIYNDDPTPRVTQQGFVNQERHINVGMIDKETPVVSTGGKFAEHSPIEHQVQEVIPKSPDSPQVHATDTTMDTIATVDQSFNEREYSMDSQARDLINSPELMSLFLYALHSFEASSLEQSTDATICLSFNKGDVAYVHSVDSSGWSEVTLIKNLQRGWVPINFFTELVKDDRTMPLSKSRIPLKLLLISTATFLNNPMESPMNGDSYFSLDHVNAIRDGVRYLLELTQCLSRSGTLVRKRPIIRKMRKTLLADWYSLMIKADSYKHSHSVTHLETLHLMALQVVKKSITFLDIWAIEQESLKKEEQTTTKQKIDLPTLRQPPFAKERLNEIHNMLFGYVGLLLGRLDMVEHNAAGCQILENITHQMILLLRELLFINKSCVQILDSQNRKQNRFDDNLDILLSLVSELVSSVKMFVTKTIDEPHVDIKTKDALYHYTAEGDDLIGVVSKMTRSIVVSVDTCYRYLTQIGDFRLGAEKQYPDFALVQITSEQFIKTCSLGMIKSMSKTKLNALKQAQRTQIKRQSRFSMVRALTDFTPEGSNLLQEFLPDSKSFIRNSVFQPYLNESIEGNDYRLPYDPSVEIVYDSDGVLIGASFRALVLMLTDELKKPGEFFITTFFLTFKLYATGEELIEELISRFNLDDKVDMDDDSIGEYSSMESRLKNRRRMIARMCQLWIQSYWDYPRDYNLIPTLINFFNEGISKYLPIESKRLIELCSKLIVVTPTKLETSRAATKSSFGNTNNSGIQLITRRLSNARTSTISHSSSILSISSLNKNLDDEEHIFEEYELAKMHSHSRNSVLLPLPGLNFNNNSLMSKSQISEVEQFVVKHRLSLGSVNWPVESLSRYSPTERNAMLKQWFECCQLQLPGRMTKELNLVDLNSFELAKQLTIIESKIFLSIKPDELLNQNFTKGHNLSPNTQQSLMFTNLLSAYVLDSILEEELSLKKRSLRLKSWLNVALSCYYLKNFNSLAAIVISLQSHILSRVVELWELLPEKYESLFFDLKKIIHPTNNYKGYRYKLDKILKEGDNKAMIPVVPYVNLFLQDLTFINEGNRDFRNSNSFLRSKIINFDKFIRVAKIISNMEYLQVGYDETPRKRRNSMFSFNSTSSLDNTLSPISQIQEFILLELLRVHQLNMGHEDRAWTLSKQLKP